MGKRNPLLLFPSSTVLFWAEEVARETGIPVEIVPAPPGHPDRCGSALEVPGSSLAALRDLLEAEGIPVEVLSDP